MIFKHVEICGKHKNFLKLPDWSTGVMKIGNFKNAKKN